MDTMVTQEPEAPAVIGPDHVQGRAFTDPRHEFSESARGWSKLSRLRAAYEKGQLEGGDQRYTAKMRHDAGARYADIFTTAQGSGRDSTQMIGVDGGFIGGDLSITIAQAVRALVAIQGRLGERDRRIVMMVCGADYRPSEAIRGVCGAAYEKAVSVRLCEALDALIEAMEAVRRRPDVISLERKL